MVTFATLAMHRAITNALAKWEKPSKSSAPQLLAVQEEH